LSEEGETDTLQERLEVSEDGEPEGLFTARSDATIADPAALLAHLDLSGHFHRDGRIGRVFHRGMVSLRENVETESLHVAIDGNRVSAHVDEASPLDVRSDRSSGYSVRRALVHNLAGMAQDVMSLLRGRQGDHRCVLNCEWASRESLDRRLETTESGWNVQLEARVGGSLDPPRLRAALRDVLGPVAERDPLEVVDCADDAAVAAARARLQEIAVAIDERPPLRVVLARHPEGDVLMFNLNHAVTDGAGGVQILRAIAGAYAGADGPAGALDFLALHDLPVRPVPPSAAVPIVRAYEQAVERLGDLRARPARIAADGGADERGHGFHMVGLSAQETRDVVDVTHPGNAGDVLMAALHRTVGDWNRRHRERGRSIGVLAPADVRPPRWPSDRIGNFSINSRVSTSRRDRSSASRALEAVTAQGSRNRRNRTGVALIAGLERAGMLAMWAKQSSVVLAPLTAHDRVDCAMLGNLGPIGDAPSFGPDGGETVELWFSPPSRSPRILVVGALVVAGRLQLTFRYPRRLLGPDAARRFADAYVSHLRAVATDASPVPPLGPRSVIDRLQRRLRRLS
jgi:NRPS condensation-like uncharacterized protein